MAEATSSWLAPMEPRPVPRPQKAALPPDVIPYGNDRPPPVVMPPAPAPPTEAEARRVLAERQQVKREADAALQAAEAAYLRARQHLALCIDDAAGFDTLDAEIAAFTAAQLRSGEGRPRHDHDETHRARIAARDQARAALSTARAAEATLATELDAARTAATDAASPHEFAVGNVLLCEAAKVGLRYLDALHQTNTLAATTVGVWDALAGASGFVMPRPVEAAIAFAGLNRVSAVEQWKRAADQLRADASAVVTIEPEPLPPPVIIPKM
jgi:hypothetical protein